jgi:hypothetical protein
MSQRVLALSFLRYAFPRGGGRSCYRYGSVPFGSIHPVLRAFFEILRISQPMCNETGITVKQLAQGAELYMGYKLGPYVPFRLRFEPTCHIAS